MLLRLARPDDVPQMLAIYAPFIRDSAVSFEYAVPSENEFAERLAKISATHPWLVAEDGAAIAGYAYASRHRDREAYQWSVETSVYVAAKHRKQGVGAKLYRALFAILRWQGYYNAYAGVTLPNEASVAFHEAFGFESVGVYRAIGYKMGAWRDVGWWQRPIQEEYVSDPTKPRSIGKINAQELRQVLGSK